MNRGAVIAAALACATSCGDREREPAGPTAQPARPLAGTEQLVVAIGADWSSQEVELARFERDGDGPWRRVGEPWPATIGRSGMAWGRGLLVDRAPALGGEAKVEGDGRTPAGVFAIGGSYGYDEGPPGTLSLPYQPLSASWRCVDDSDSELYNRVFDAHGVNETWKSAEVMRRDDELYRYVIAIDHNGALGESSEAATVAGAGSCIFFHVWSRADASTVGCVAMDRPRIEELMRWLRPDRRPAVAILPRAAYRAKRRLWDLPAP